MINNDGFLKRFVFSWGLSAEHRPQNKNKTVEKICVGKRVQSV